MTRKLVALTLATIALTGTMGVAAVGTLDGAAQAANDDSATVSVSATGTASAEPDQAVVHVAVTAEAPNAGNASDQVAEGAEQLRDATEDDNLSIASVETTDYQVYQQDDEGETTYVARHAFAITTDEPTEAGAVIDVAVANGADEVNGVRFALSEDRRQEVRADAIDAGVTDAQLQAETLADSADLTLGGIESISTSDSGGFGPRLEAADAGTQIDVSPVSVSVTVQATYNATGS